MSNPVQHVFLITDGPKCSVSTQNGKEAKTEVRLEASLRELEDYRKQETPVVFRMTSGFICLNVCDENGCLEIDPLLLAPLPMIVTIEDLVREVHNPNGVNIFARVQEIKQYRTSLLSDRYCIPVIESGDLVRISYDLCQNVGGFCKIEDPHFGRGIMPLVNSRCELCREYADAKSGRRGRGVYKIAGTSRELPA